MRSAIILSVLLLGCDSQFDCEDAAACELVEARYDIASRGVQGRQSVVFSSGDTRYALVHFEYGTAQDCLAGCFYSHYCSFVVGGEEKPLSYDWYEPDEELFDPTLYCPSDSASSSFDCAMPAFELAIFADPKFRAWVEDPDDVNDEMRWCRHPLAFGYNTGALP